MEEGDLGVVDVEFLAEEGQNRLRCSVEERGQPEKEERRRLSGEFVASLGVEDLKETLRSELLLENGGHFCVPETAGREDDSMAVGEGPLQGSDMGQGNVPHVYDSHLKSWQEGHRLLQCLSHHPYSVKETENLTRALVQSSFVRRGPVMKVGQIVVSPKRVSFGRDS